VSTQNETAPAVDQQRLVSPLQHGTEAEHRATLARAKAAGVKYVWSGDVRRNRYLAENIRFAEESGILTTEWLESEQESGWRIMWANDRDHQQPKEAR
jgi:hypothetical protein